MVKKLSIFIASGIELTAIYFISWALYDGNNFSMKIEILFSALTSIVAFSIFVALYKFITTSNNKYVAKIRMLVDVMILKAPNYVKDKEEWSQDVVEPTLDRLNE